MPEERTALFRLLALTGEDRPQRQLRLTTQNLIDY
jgi:hypothetical protein